VAEHTQRMNPRAVPEGAAASSPRTSERRRYRAA
jgi:hypothetical protein